MKTFLFTFMIFILGFLISQQVLALSSFGFKGDDFPTYTVPTNDQSLLPYAIFPLVDLKTQMNGQRAQVRYTLPRELTGRPIEVQMEGGETSPGVWRLKGPKSVATCAAEKCQVRYHNLNLNPSEVEGFLRNQNMQPTELQGRITLARFFHDDPFGIVQYPFKAGASYPHPRP